MWREIPHQLYIGFAAFRCGDANIVEVPVEVETPDHHYYHLAFFTVRKVEALEELTWDYGIDFDDQTHPIKAFSCRCGSKLCRDRRAQIKLRNKRRAAQFDPKPPRGLRNSSPGRGVRLTWTEARFRGAIAQFWLRRTPQIYAQYRSVHARYRSVYARYMLGTAQYMLGTARYLLGTARYMLGTTKYR
ncbi:Histone-lysine N-methyltransferase SUVR4 [Dendrobium catenatum]|uniref:Histone-lysine N-methyltransferase SUVR4 n=1 Tax=Dendrobium catenatum TaxID=906689 RepID=A0A2I0X975_9ASPA|nr:Histone-lysine N-methyltransferase SUVR4 [Dendrobium catenatum]